jgi:hypothetical protein
LIRAKCALCEVKLSKFFPVIFVAIAIASGPEIRIKAIAPMPGAVDNAQIVVCFISLFIRKKSG